MHLLKTSQKYCACHTKRLLTHYETCWNVTKCHAWKRGYAALETSKSDHCCRTRHRHDHTGLTRPPATKRVSYGLVTTPLVGNLEIMTKHRLDILETLSITFLSCVGKLYEDILYVGYHNKKTSLSIFLLRGLNLWTLEQPTQTSLVLSVGHAADQPKR